MTWEQIHQTYPDQWVLMEALKAHTEGNKRIFEELGFRRRGDNADVFPRYRQLRREFPGKEIIFYHASRPTMDVAVRHWAGVRTAP